jgi:NAD+ synthase (glutamine-hydrolysing)
MMPHLKVACATVNQTPLDWSGNFKRIVDAIQHAQSQGVELLCFPELTITGYGSEDLFLSYWYPKKAIQQILNLLPYCDNITVAVGTPIRIGSAVYNCMAIIEDAKLKGFVAKQYMAIDGVHYEFRWFTPWKAGEVIDMALDGQNVPLGDIVFDKNGLRYGFEICEDAWRGDLRPGFRLKTRSVDLIFNPSASHFAMGKTSIREELIKSSSTLLNATYFYVNLLGNEAGRMIFDGEILVAHQGKILKKNKLLSFDDFQVLPFDYFSDISKLAEIQPYHDKNEEFIAATTLGLFDYLRKSKSKGFVLSLSGGADSSCCAVLIAEMVRRGVHQLGKNQFLSKLGIPDLMKDSISEKEIVNEILTTVYQSTHNSSKATFESAKKLAESIGAKFHHWDISEEVASYSQKIEKVIERKLNWETDDISLQNIQARTRSPIIWMLANLKNALLITTSNRSEGDVGYATMDGDMSGSIAPIAGVDKVFVISWLKWAEENLGYFGLNPVNHLSPSAELRPLEFEQTDEQDLMPYAIIVEIEKLAIRDHKSPLDVFLLLKDKINVEEKLLKRYIQKFFRLWSRNQWKRERTAPSFHLDEFNVDPKTWCRFPILSGGFEEELLELEQYSSI